MGSGRGKVSWAQEPGKGWDREGAEQEGVGLGRRKFPGADRKPCVTFGLCSHPVIPDSRPFLASLGVGAGGDWGLQLGPNQRWLQVGQAGGEGTIGLKLGSGMPPGQHMTLEK